MTIFNFHLFLALGRCSDALNEYISNIKQSPDPTITNEMFQTELAIAYDILSSNWLTSRDPKVGESVLVALALMFPMLSIEKISQNTTRIIPVLLNLYKKQREPLPITQCLGSVIQVTVFNFIFNDCRYHKIVNMRNSNVYLYKMTEINYYVHLVVYHLQYFQTAHWRVHCSYSLDLFKLLLFVYYDQLFNISCLFCIFAIIVNLSACAMLQVLKNIIINLQTL